MVTACAHSDGGGDGAGVRVCGGSLHGDGQVSRHVTPQGFEDVPEAEDDVSESSPSVVDVGVATARWSGTVPRRSCNGTTPICSTSKVG